LNRRRSEAASQRDAVVDVSNVCRSPILPPHIGAERGVWPRIDTIVDGWRRAHGPGADIFLVADNSLKHLLEPGVLRRWFAICDRYGLVEVSVADDRVLDLARDRGLSVITGDHYTDFRKRHPWIEREPDRFWHWEMRAGDVRFVPLGITAIPRHRASEFEERYVLRGHGLDPKRDRYILTSRWRCTNRMCLQARLWQDQLLLWPRVDARRQAVCPSCEHPLERLGDRRLLRQLIVLDDRTNDELLRFPLEAGTPLVVGRGHVDNGIDLAATDARFAQLVSSVSRQHVVMRLQDTPPHRGRVTATELGSSNGTSFRRFVDGRPQDAQPVVEGQSVRLAVGDQLVLADDVRIEVSGQRFLSDAVPPSASATRATGPTAVRRIRRPPGES